MDQDVRERSTDMRRECAMISRFRATVAAGVVYGLLAGAVGCASQTEARTAEIKLPTIQCQMCANTVTAALKGVDGVSEVEVKVKEKVARVGYVAERTSVAKLEEAVAKSGYQANDTKADPEAYAKLAGCCKVPE